MATGAGKPDKALKEKQNKLTLMGKVLMRDKHNNKRGDRDSKATSSDHLETIATTTEDNPENLDKDAKLGFRGSTESLGKSKIRSSFMDKVRFRDKGEKRKRRERDSLATSQELDAEDAVAKDNFKGSTESLGKSKGLSSLWIKSDSGNKSDKQSRKNRDSMATSQDLDTEVPVAKEDFRGSNESLGKRQSSFLDMVRFRDKSDKHNRKERDSKSYSNDLETVAEVVTKETQDPSDEPFSRQQQHRSSFIDKVLMRDRQDKVSKKDGNPRYPARTWIRLLWRRDVRERSVTWLLRYRARSRMRSGGGRWRIRCGCDTRGRRERPRGRPAPTPCSRAPSMGD